MSRPFPLDAEQERFVADLLSYMTLEEKLGQLDVLAAAPDGADSDFERSVASGRIGGIVNLVDRDTARSFQRLAVEQTRLGIPLLFATDGTRANGKTQAATGWSRAASWDVPAMERLGRESAEAALATGSRWLLEPAIAFDRSGTAEAVICSGEPVLLAALSAGFVRGVGERESAIAPTVFAGLRYSGADADEIRAGDPEMLATLTAVMHEDCLGSVVPLPPALVRFAGIALEECHRVLEIVGGQRGWTVALAQEVIGEGLLSEGEIEDAARGVLSVKSALGLFRDPYAALAPSTEPAPALGTSDSDSAEHALARRAMVLLRNRGSILPLNSDLRRILVIGDPEGIAHGCREGLEDFGISTRSLPGLSLRDEDESFRDMAPHDPFAIALASDAARRSDVVLLALDPHAFDASSEGLARLTEPMLTLIRALGATGRPIVAIVASGTPVDLGPAAEIFSTILLAWHSAIECPTALAELLSGEFSPSGRLPIALTSETEEACFAFGHGLGYGEVVYSDLLVDQGEDRLSAQATVRNPGEFALLETVQLYTGNSARTQIQLAGFERVPLEPGEEKIVRFTLGATELGTPGADGRYRVASGFHRIAIGKSAQRVLKRDLAIDETFARAITLGRAASDATRSTGTFDAS